MSSSSTNTEDVFDISLYGKIYRIRGMERSKAVTAALDLFVKDFPDFDMPLTILRNQVKTRQVDAVEELMEQRLDSMNEELS